MNDPLERLIDAAVWQPNATPELTAAVEDVLNALVEGESMDLMTVASLMGQAGGRKGGLARAAKLSPQRRREIAKLGAAARWNHKASAGGGQE